MHHDHVTSPTVHALSCSARFSSSSPIHMLVALLAYMFLLCCRRLSRHCSSALHRRRATSQHAAGDEAGDGIKGRVSASCYSKCMRCNKMRWPLLDSVFYNEEEHRAAWQLRTV